MSPSEEDQVPDASGGLPRWAVQLLGGLGIALCSFGGGYRAAEPADRVQEAPGGLADGLAAVQVQLGTVAARQEAAAAAVAELRQDVRDLRADLARMRERGLDSAPR